jgi:hypothetical protein
MRVRLLHHADASALARAVAGELARQGLVAAPADEPADVALVLIDRGALADGLGPALRHALEQGVPLVPVLLGADLVPQELAIAKKHLPLAADAATAVKHVLERRAEGMAGRLEGKKELFGLGLLAALLGRRP